MAALQKTALPLLALLLLMQPASAADPISIERSTVYYNIGGNTVPAITQSIRQNMPPQTDSFVGMTAYVFSWAYDYAPTGPRRCQTSNAKVAIEITTYLPRHASIRQAPATVRAQWQKYSTALERHEARHAADFIAIGSQIPKAIADVHTRNCSTIQAAANAVGQTYVVRAQAKGDAYDALTDHGVTDGAAWPGL
ncbi:MAG TPA: DUF922 domain-containing protein [Devosia sp.]|nr:DUF922 domain-containing protein [Devosia sp.]